MRSDDTTVKVSVNDRSQTDLNKRYNGTNVDWKPIEKQLLMWGNLFRLGKKLRLYISINNIEDTGPPLSRIGDKRGKSSVTKRMLTEREARVDAEQAAGQPTIWRDVYQTMRCPGPPCRHDGQWCWQDPVGKRHYRLTTLHMRRLVQYVEEGGILESHDDVPDDVREDLYAEETQRQKKKQKSNDQLGGSMGQPININVLPAQLSQSVTPVTAGTAGLVSNTTSTDFIDISGLLDIAVEEYTDWHLSRVSRETYRDHLIKARDVAIENCLDLKQIFTDQDPAFFVRQGVKIGVARRFVSDIPDWVKWCGQNK